MDKKKISEAQQKKEEEQEAQRKLDIEVLHQQDESKRRALGKAMLADAAANRPTFNKSALKLLNNFQSEHNNKSFLLFLVIKQFGQ